MHALCVHMCSGCKLTISYSDGVGRTGTFLCIHSQLERVKTEGVVDIFQAIKSVRMQRPGLVSDAVSHNATLSGCYISMWCFPPQAQYAFCHEVVASYVDTFETYANFKEVM